MIPIPNVPIFIALPVLYGLRRPRESCKLDFFRYLSNGGLVILEREIVTYHSTFPVSDTLGFGMDIVGTVPSFKEWMIQKWPLNQ